MLRQSLLALCVAAVTCLFAADDASAQKGFSFGKKSGSNMKSNSWNNASRMQSFKKPTTAIMNSSSRGMQNSQRFTNSKNNFQKNTQIKNMNGFKGHFNGQKPQSKNITSRIDIHKFNNVKKPNIHVPHHKPVKNPGFVITKPGTHPFQTIKPNKPTGIHHPIVKPYVKPHVKPIIRPHHPVVIWQPPRHCDWWRNVCQPIQHYRPADVVHCNWNYVRSNAVVQGEVVENVRWFLGVEGIVLPGKGLGVEAVEPNSPADQVGLKAGMVITEANGVALESNEIMSEVIAASNGVLEVTVMVEGSDDLLTGTIEMTQVVSSKF